MRTYSIKIENSQCKLDQQLYRDFEKEANYFRRKIEGNIDNLQLNDFDKILVDAFHKNLVRIDRSEIGIGESNKIVSFVGYITLSYTEDENYDPNI